jgi:hypothetical protein
MNVKTEATGFFKQVETVKSHGAIWQKTLCSVTATRTSDYVCIEGLQSNETNGYTSLMNIHYYLIYLHSGGWNQGPLDTAAT